MNRMIFVTGFARGGTTWLRNCIASHPDVAQLHRELVLFREFGTNSEKIEQSLESAVSELKTEEQSAPRFVEKSPANAPHIDAAAQAFPETKFIFIIRDPRDVFISHKRGTRAWMGGRNSQVDGCLSKVETYFGGYERAKSCANVLLVRYEDLHQNFHATMKRVFDFIGIHSDPATIADCYRKNDFWNVASRHVERRDEAARKGVVGDWVLHLEPKEADWIRSRPFWTRFMEAYDYTWDQLTYGRLIKAFSECSPRALHQDDLIHRRLAPDRVNILLTHDIDRLTRRDFSIESILDTARAEAELGLPSHFFFLPLDDVRYKAMKREQIIELIHDIQKIHSGASIGLHFNAAERFFSADMPDADDDHPSMTGAIEYLHAQVEAYRREGVTFQTATAHGYGRRKKRPNNRDSVRFTEELRSIGILLWDTVIRPELYELATGVTSMADVGGAMSAKFMPTIGSVISGDTYRRFPAGHLIHVLTHPGNYDSRAAMPLGRRTNINAPKAESVA